MVESSHAFRADRSQHTCLRQIKQQFRNTNWYIVGDTSSCFTKVNHKKCLHLLGHTKKYALQRNRLKPSIRCVSPFTNSLDSPTIRSLRCLPLQCYAPRKGDRRTRSGNFGRPKARRTRSGTEGRASGPKGREGAKVRRGEGNRRVSNSGIGYEGGCAAEEARKWTGGLPESANNNAPKLCKMGRRRTRSGTRGSTQGRPKGGAPYRRVTFFGRAAQTSPLRSLPSVALRSACVLQCSLRSPHPTATIRRSFVAHSRGAAHPVSRCAAPEARREGVQPLQQPVLRQLPSLKNKCFAPVTSNKVAKGASPVSCVDPSVLCTFL